MDEYEVATANLTAQRHSDDKISILFNNTIETDDSDGSLSGQYILNQYQGWKKEALNLLKSWCIFSYREFYRNLLVLVGELSDHIYGSKTNIPNQLLEMFCLDDERIHTHLRTWTTSGYFGHGFSYSAMIDAKLNTIQHQNIRPKQFILDQLVSISTITESICVGWDTIASSYFKSKILKTLSSGAHDFSLALTFRMSFKLPTRLSKDF